MRITNGTATVCVEVLHEAKAGHWGFPEKAMQNPGSASQENCLNDVNHTGVCKYGLRWSLTRKYGCGNSFGSCRSFCCPGCLEVLPLLPVIALPGQHRGKDAPLLHSDAEISFHQTGVNPVRDRRRKAMLLRSFNAAIEGNWEHPKSEKVN